jgi:hypothetical protein
MVFAPEYQSRMGFRRMLNRRACRVGALKSSEFVLRELSIARAWELE